MIKSQEMKKGNFTLHYQTLKENTSNKNKMIYK